MKKILLIKHGSLGDIISSTSVINDIKKHFTRDQVYILTSDKYKDFFCELNFFDKIIIDNREGISKTIEVIKKIISNRKLPLEERFAAQLKLAKIPRNSARIRIRNRCEVSGRPHGVYRKLKISRIALRDMASSGKIPGITKSSW